jgi:D-alanyl-D-alanine carboxypeptidase
MRICDQLKINPRDLALQVTAKASQQFGTLAYLMEGDCASIEDLLYALMLNSGNDAAVALAENLGALLYFH